MSRITLRYCLLIVGLLLLPCSAVADTNLKQQVFRDCQAAAARAAQLSQDEQRDFIGYLSRILTMQAGVPAELFLDGSPGVPLVGQPNAALDGLRGQNMWQIFEPSRENEAKRCAAQLLTAAAPQSVESLPAFINALQDVTLASDVREAFESAVWAIVMKVEHEPQFAVPRETFSKIISQLAGDATGYLAGNVLMELHDRTVPILSEELFSPDERQREALRALLLRLDPNGKLLGARLVELLNSPDTAIRERSATILGELLGYRLDALPPLLAHLSDPSPEVSAVIWKALGHLARHLGSEERVVIPGPAFFSALTEFPVATAEHRAILELVLEHLQDMDAARLDQLWQLARSDRDDDLRQRAIRIVIASHTQRKEDVDRLLDALYDPSLPVRLLAVRGLGDQTGRTDEIGSALLRVVKSSGAKGVESGREDLVLAVASSLMRLPKVAASDRFVPYLIDTLAQPTPAERAEPSQPGAMELSSMDLLVQIGNEAVNPLLKALKSSEPLVRRRAAIVLGRTSGEDAAVMRAIVPLLKDSVQEVRDAAREQLSHTTLDLRAELERLLTGKEIDGRLAAALVLVDHGDRRPEIVSILRDAFSAGSCVEQLDLVSEMLAVDDTFRSKVQPFLVQCLKNGDMPSSAVMAVLLRVAPLTVEAQTSLMELAATKLNDRVFQRALLEHAHELGLDGERLQPYARQLLSSEDQTVRGSLLELLAHERDLARALLPELERLAQDDQEQVVSRIQAAVAVANVDAGAVGYEKLILQELDGDRFPSVLAVTDSLRPDLALPLLTTALRQIASDRRPALVAHIGRFGPQAIGARESIEPLLRNGDALLRYQAAVAIIRMAPQDSDVIHLLQTELVGRYGDQLAREDLPKEVLSVVEQIVKQPRTFVEQQAAEHLEQVMRERPEHPAS